MNDNLRVKIITPINIVIECDAVLVTMPGEDGQFGVMPNHAKLIANLVQGLVVIKQVDEKVLSYFIDNAVANIDVHQLEIVTEYAVDISDTSLPTIIATRIESYKNSLSRDVDEQYQQWVISRIERDQLLLKYINNVLL